MIRLAKKIAESGVSSRREAERLIEEGRVKVDGEVISSPVFFVDNSNLIEVNGKRLPKQSSDISVWKMNKPQGYITTRFDPKGRKTVFDLFPNSISGRLLYVGRLDINSEGLLLFTNNGNLSRKLELPSSELCRTYKVRFFGKLSSEQIDQMKKGLVIQGVRYGGINIEVQSAKFSANTWAIVTLKEGKNREIRRVLEHFDCSVNRLIRLSYGPIKLNDTKLGKVEKLSDDELQKLLKCIR